MPALFSPKVNKLPRLLGVAFLACVFLCAGVLFYAASPKTWRVGFTPEQPIPFSHYLHADLLKMDCAACHLVSADSGSISFPDAQSCLACHKHILPDSPKLIPLHAAANPDSQHYTGQPLVWKKVHSLPDHVVFPHSSHTNRGIACSSCHGDMTRADVTSVKEPLSMSWCLDCHRNPTPHLVPLESVTGQKDTHSHSESHSNESTQVPSNLSEKWKIAPPTDCSACHQ